MKIPEEFMDLVRCFRFDTITEPFSEAAWIESRMRTLNAEKRGIIREFLEQIFEQAPEDVQLREIWDAGQPDFYFGNSDQLRHFLHMVRDRI